MKPMAVRIFVAKCKQYGLPEPEREYKFHPIRRFRFDFCFPDARLAVEIDGGVWLPGGGRHNRGAGYLKDQEKMNLAVLHGWRVLHYTPQNIDYKQIREAYNGIAACDPID